MAMGNQFTHSPQRIYYIVISIWVLLFVTLMLGVVAFDLQRAKSLFSDNAISHFQQANNRVHINESILEGFAAMVSVSSTLDRSRIRSYAQKMLKQYPYIFMFEIVEKVSHDQLEEFTGNYRRKIDPNFALKAFDYEQGRRWQPLKEKPYYMPIVFMEPFPAGSREVLGLDISSNEFFMRSLEESEQIGRALSSDPFKLVEGHLAYLVHRPIAITDKQGRAQGNNEGRSGFVMLVIRADTLLDKSDHELALPGISELLYHPSFKSTEPAGHIYRHESPEPDWFARWLLPRLSMSRVLDSQSQPFVLLIEQQLGYNIISWGKLLLTLLIAVITFAVVMVYARLYYQNEMERVETTVQLFHLANYDALTGLANRNLLDDRLSHAISRTARQNGQFVLLFLDLEKFKPINDLYGHDIGDEILKRAAERLRACVRIEDTIARLGGDEFVLVMESISDQDSIDHVIEKIKSGFEQPFELNSQSMIVGISIGSAVYPEDGADMEALLNHADSKMYEDKRSRK